MQFLTDGLGEIELLLAGIFLSVDLLFVTSNLSKIRHGGWFPIALAVVVENDVIASTVARKVLDTYYKLHPIKAIP